MGGSYYMQQLMNSNLRATREGVAIIGECDGMGLRNYNAHVEERYMNEFLNYFPTKHKESLWLNTPTVANLLYAVIKPLMTKEQKTNFHLGCRLEGYDEGRLDQLFNVPTPEAAQESAILRMEGYLKERYDNVATYRLPPLPEDGELAVRSGDDETA